MSPRRPSIDTVIGLDIGTTTSKALIRPLGRGNDIRIGRRSDVRSGLGSDGQPGRGGDVQVVERATPWCTTDAGGTEIDPHVLLDLACELLGAAVHTAEAAWGPVDVLGVSVTGMAESGVLLDPRGRARTAAIAWFDRRGEAEVEAARRQSAQFVAAFPGVTGLPWSFQASLAKLMAGRRSADPVTPGSTWLSIPEWIVHGLGGDRVREPSLASRTGLIRQDTGAPWDDAFAIAGLPAGLLPDAAAAGTPVGKLACAEVPDQASGAVLSVAGHDHPVAALAVGAIGADELFNSSGTADVMARAVRGPLTDGQRAAIVAARWSAGAHIVSDTELLLAGGSGGLLLRRVLHALGAAAADARDRLDAASMRITELPPGLIVRGDGRTQQDVEIRLRDDASPAALWSAATACTAELAAGMLADLDSIVAPHRRAIAAGGWIRMASVRAARSAVIDRLEYSDIRQPGATGAALVAEYSLRADTQSLADFVHDASQLADA